MFQPISRRILSLLLVILLLFPAAPARADGFQNIGRDVTLGVVGVSAAIVVVAVIFVVHYKSTAVRGCVASGPDGLELTSDSDRRVYQLVGSTSDIKPGEIVRLKGKKKNGKGGSHSTFTVKALSTDYGPCPAPANP